VVGAGTYLGCGGTHCTVCIHWHHAGQINR
jgi:hypothetical protein